MTAPLVHRAVGHPLAFVILSPILHLLLASAVRAIAQISSDGWWWMAVWAAWFGIAVAAPLLHVVLHGPTVWIQYTVACEAQAPLTAVSKFIRCAENLDEYEQKVSGCTSWGQHEGGGHFMLWGWWWGLPWCKPFKMTFARDGGFHAALNDDGWQWLPKVSKFRGGGGFKLSDGTSPGHTVLSHYERYGWPIIFPLVWPLALSCWRAWHARGMEVEMQVIKAQIEEMMEATQMQSGIVADHFGQNSRWKEGKYTAISYIKECASRVQSPTNAKLSQRMALHCTSCGF